MLKRLWWITAIALSLQAALLVGDGYFLPGKNMLVYILETVIPYGLIPLFVKMGGNLPNPLPRDLRKLGEFLLILGVLLFIGLTGLQILSWKYKGPLNGSLFYLPSFLLSLVWAYKLIRKTRV